MNSRPWLRNRFGLTIFFLIPFGWQGEFVPQHTLPEGCELPGDPTMERSTTDGNRIIRSWKHQAVLKLPERTTGYICYRFNGGTWRIRVRDLHMEEFREFKLNLSLQATYVAFVSEAGEEIRLEIVESSIPVNDPRYAHLPTY